MAKFTEFYQKAVSDPEIRAKLEQILAGKEMEQADDQQLQQIGQVAKDLGYEFTLEEVKEFLHPQEERELSDDQLDAVAGGFLFQGKEDQMITCTSAGVQVTTPEDGVTKCVMSLGNVEIQEDGTVPVK